MKFMSYKSFTVSEELRNSLKIIPDEFRLKFYDATVNYGIEGIEPDFGSVSVEAALWILIKQKIDRFNRVKIGSDTTEERSGRMTRLYLMKDNLSDLYKIGRSISPKARERTLLSQAPSISLIWISDWVNREYEKKLHRIFKEKRIRGEWFDLTEDDIKYIKGYNYGN